MTNERTLGIIGDVIQHYYYFGERAASLYSHFANKQGILDTVVETVLKGYADHSIDDWLIVEPVDAFLT